MTPDGMNTGTEISIKATEASPIQKKKYGQSIKYVVSPVRRSMRLKSKDQNILV